MKTSVLSFLFFLFCLSLTAQYRGDTIYSDFNKDGFEDRLEWYYDGGSGFGGRFASLTNGKTNDILEFDTYGCFCQIMHLIILPEELCKKENADFLKAAEKEVLPKKRYAPDPSLQWIIDGLFSNKKINNAYFEYIIDPGTGWSEDAFVLPRTYYIDARDHLIHKLVESFYEIPDAYKESGNRGYLIYYGHNHFRNPSGDSIQLIDKNSIYKVYRTSHGVMVKKKNLFKWLFITEQALTGAPDKLRWESVKKIKLIGNYVIVQQSKPMREHYDLYVINIETGLCGRLKITKYRNDEPMELGSLYVNEKHIIIDVKGKITKFQLTELFNELEKLYLKK